MKLKTQKIAFTLAMIAGALCVGAFVYKYFSEQGSDFTILAAGVFIMALGYGIYYSARNKLIPASRGKIKA